MTTANIKQELSNWKAIHTAFSNEIESTGNLKAKLSYLSNEFGEHTSLSSSMKLARLQMSARNDLSEKRAKIVNMLEHMNVSFELISNFMTSSISPTEYSSLLSEIRQQTLLVNSLIRDFLGILNADISHDSDAGVLIFIHSCFIYSPYIDMQKLDSFIDFA